MVVWKKTSLRVNKEMNCFDKGKKAKNLYRILQLFPRKMSATFKSSAGEVSELELKLYAVVCDFQTHNRCISS